MGRTLSELAKCGLRRTSILRLGEENGVPVILREPGFVPVTSELVYRMQDEEE